MSNLGEHKGDGIRYAMHLSAPDGGTAAMLRNPDGGWVSWNDYERLKSEVESLMTTPASRLLRASRAENERLRLAGDEMAKLLSCCGSPPTEVKAWNDAKKGTKTK